MRIIKRFIYITYIKISNSLHSIASNFNRKEILQSKILRIDSLEKRKKLWRVLKRTQNSLYSWHRFLKEGCNVSYVVVKPVNDSIFYIEDDFKKPLSLSLPLDPGVGLKTLITKEYDPSNVEFFYDRSLKKPLAPITVIDVGANIGLFSRQCFTKFNKKLVSIHAYEPDPEIFLLLQKNLPKNNKVNLVNSAIGDKNETGDFFIDQNHPSSSSLLASSLPKKYYNAHKTTVEILSAKLESKKWLSKDSLIFYKSDTQGYDQTIAATLGIDFFKNVDAALIEVFFSYSKIEPKTLKSFRLILDLFPYKASLSQLEKLLTTEQIITRILSNEDFDLALWK